MSEPNEEFKVTMFAVNPSRLAWGRYDHARGRDAGEGDIHASYSADTIATAGKVRNAFRFQGRLMATVSMSGSGGVEQAEAYDLVPVSAFAETPTTYSEKLATVDSAEAARHDPKGFYHGMKVICGKQMFVMSGPPVIFEAARSPARPNDEAESADPKQLSLF